MDTSFILSCESTIDLPYSYCEARGIPVLFYSYQVDGVSYEDDMGRDPAALPRFYGFLDEGKLPTTAQLNEFQYESFFDALLQQGDVLHITFGSGMTASVQNAMLAAESLREKYPERKLIAIDSLCASLGEGLLLYLAAKKQQSGASMDEVADYVRETIPHLCHWFTVNDLMFLKRGGRVDAATALVGTVLQIKPVMHTDDAGTLKNVTKARGRKAALKALAQKLADTAINPAEQTVFICHGDCIEDAEYTAEQIRALTPVKDIIINYVGPVIGAHTGPGVISVFFVGTHR